MPEKAQPEKSDSPIASRVRVLEPREFFEVVPMASGYIGREWVPVSRVRRVIENPTTMRGAPGRLFVELDGEPEVREVIE